jgi:hypothetical protein
VFCQRPFDLSDLSVECLRFVLFDLNLCLPQTEVLVCKGEQAILRREKGADLVPNGPLKRAAGSPPAAPPWCSDVRDATPPSIYVD